MIEVFSRTGLYIVGFKVHRMSVAQAEEFYGPVLPVLEDKLGAEKGREAWEDIVEFMSGGRPSAVERRSTRCARHRKMHRASFIRAKTRCAKSAKSSDRPIRARRRPVRSAKNLARSIMVNAAHASDSAENAKREMEIVQVDENNFKPLIENFYARP